jgi:hypothetical protein
VLRVLAHGNGGLDAAQADRLGRVSVEAFRREAGVVPFAAGADLRRSGQAAAPAARRRSRRLPAGSGGPPGRRCYPGPARTPVAPPRAASFFLAVLVAAVVIARSPSSRKHKRPMRGLPAWPCARRSSLIFHTGTPKPAHRRCCCAGRCRPGSSVAGRPLPARQVATWRGLRASTLLGTMPRKRSRDSPCDVGNGHDHLLDALDAVRLHFDRRKHVVGRVAAPRPC